MKNPKRRVLAKPNVDPEPTAFLRRHAVWIVPGVFVVHSVVVYGAYPGLAQASLVAALFSLPAGLAIRWLRSTTRLLALAIALIVFLMLYVMGIVAPVAFLVLANHREWVPLATVVSAVVLLAVLYWRVRTSFQNEWALPLDKAPGVEVNMATLTLVRRPVSNQSTFAAKLAIGMLVLLVSLVVLARGALTNQLIVFVLGPFCVAILCTEFVARGFTYWWVARRWEREHGIRFRVS